MLPTRCQEAGWRHALQDAHPWPFMRTCLAGSQLTCPLACPPPLLCAGGGQPGGQLTGDAAQAESERQQLALYGVDD